VPRLLSVAVAVLIGLQRAEASRERDLLVGGEFLAGNDEHRVAVDPVPERLEVRVAQGRRGVDAVHFRHEHGMHLPELDRHRGSWVSERD
jgi:hypothetical protein